MRILTWQNAVLGSMAALGVALSACGSSDEPRPQPGAGAGNVAGSGVGGGSAGTPVTGAGAAGTPVTGGGAGNMAGSGTGGGTAGGTSGPSVCDGLGTKTFTVADNSFIDNFECPIAENCNADMVANGWSAFNDLGAPGADAADNMIKMAQIAPGYMSAHAGQYKGTMANVSTVAPGFGVGAVFNAVIDPAAGILCGDITAFDGVSFWAKAATAGSKITVNFVIPKTNAAGMNAELMKPNGGDCKTACYNHPRKSVTLTDTWAQYTVAFADAAGGSAKVGTVLQQIGFFSPDATWDFSLDEIAFYKGTAPTAPIMAPEAP